MQCLRCPIFQRPLYELGRLWSRREIFMSSDGFHRWSVVEQIYSSKPLSPPYEPDMCSSVPCSMQSSCLPRYAPLPSPSGEVQCDIAPSANSPIVPVAIVRQSPLQTCCNYHSKRSEKSSQSFDNHRCKHVPSGPPAMCCPNCKCRTLGRMSTSSCVEPMLAECVQMSHMLFCLMLRPRLRRGCCHAREHRAKTRRAR